MKQKEIYEFISEIAQSLQRKVEGELKMETLPETAKEYTKGQLYEARYILENIEKIIFRD